MLCELVIFMKQLWIILGLPIRVSFYQHWQITVICFYFWLERKKFHEVNLTALGGFAGSVHAPYVGPLCGQSDPSETRK